MKEFLTHFAVKLEKYFQENIKNLDDLVFFPEILNKTTSFIENIQKNPENDFVKFEDLNIFLNKKFDFLSNLFDNLNNKLLEKLKTRYDIYND